MEELRSRQLNKSSNVAKVRQELRGNAIMTKTETNESSLQEVKITEPFYETLEARDENSTNQITEKVNNEPAPARGRKRFSPMKKIISFIFKF